MTDPRPGMPGLFLKIGRVNPGFCDSKCFGRVGVIFDGELPNPREGPKITLCLLASRIKKITILHQIPNYIQLFHNQAYPVFYLCCHKLFL